MSNLIKNPFIKGSYYYKYYENYYNYKTNVLNCKYLKYSEYPEYSTSPKYLVDNLIPETMKADNIIPFSELIELDILSRNISTEIDYSNTFDITELTEFSESSEPTEYSDNELSKDDPQFVQISSSEPASRYLCRPMPCLPKLSIPMPIPIDRPIQHITHLSTPMKQIKPIKKVSGRRCNMPLYDDDIHIKRRTLYSYKKEIMYKTMTFISLLDLYVKLPQHKFYFKFENWLLANNITDLETTKKYDSEYKLYRNIIYEKV